MGITCLVIFVLMLGLWVWFAGMIARVPKLRNYAVCVEHVREVSGALDRYARRNGKYPDKLADLSPNFIESKDDLHCPADRRPDGVASYDYTPPPMNAPDSTQVIVCKRHVIFGTPAVLVLHKDGRMYQQLYVHGKPQALQPIPNSVH